ncbi:phage terminase large subunit [Anaerosolibacter sp.]|uniref:phage terminase large subunit n=1 Tax=Anaerosolibacter sp. TaxID=1872527 RepID=UPI0039F14250
MNELKLKGYPNDRQKEFFTATSRHIAYGGARGGGKSWAMRRKFVLLALRYPKLRILLLRRTLPELEANHIMPLLEELNGFAKYNDQKKIFVFPNGSFIKLGYCKYEKDVFQYQGHEYDVIGLEEATHFTETQKDFLTTCNRNTRSDFTPRMYYTSNPGNVGHVWFKRLFVDKDHRGNEKPEDYVFIPARVYDNKVLMEMNPEYVSTLENLPENLKRAHLHGDWDVFEGQYFSEFNRDIHVVEPFVIPDHWNKYTTKDYGLDMLANYWIAIDTYNNAYVYKELYESGLIVSKATNKIKKINGNDKIKIKYAPPDLQNRQKDTGKSIFDLFAESGEYLSKADNSRVNGWMAVKEWLKIIDEKDVETGEIVKTSRLKIFSNCVNLIRTLPQLQRDERDPNDVATEPHEITHAPDALRYFCIMRQPPTKQKSKLKGAYYTPGELSDLGYKTNTIKKVK